jgi:hypothetical protein
VHRCQQRSVLFSRGKKFDLQRGFDIEEYYHKEITSAKAVASGGATLLSSPA